MSWNLTYLFIYHENFENCWGETKCEINWSCSKHRVKKQWQDGEIKMKRFWQIWSIPYQK